jgi:hypothetical protein
MKKDIISSWYLKHIIIHDLQSRQKSYFICEKWFSLDKNDCQIERMLPISLDREKTEFKYLISRQTKEKLSDGHLWFSIFTRPAQSSFTRLDRLTCCFVLLSISMLMNIMYYGMDSTPNRDGLKIGPVNVTLQQLSVGIITNLIVFPPTLLLIQLFRRIKHRQPRIKKLKKILDEKNLINDDGSSIDNLNENKKKKKKMSLKFPWWFIFVAYILSFAFASVSLFFVVIKGLVLGDVQVTKWMTSLIISFITSILLTQPIQVIFLICFVFKTIITQSSLNPLNVKKVYNCLCL